MKNLLLFLPVFLWLHACSQSPAPDAAAGQSNSILSDTTGASLGDAPTSDYRLFKFARKDGERSVIDLKLLRLSDLKEALVSTLPAEDEFKVLGYYPKFYWSKNGRYLITENATTDSIYHREVVLFDLKNFNVGKRKEGNLLNFDSNSDLIFVYRQTAERQVVTFFNVNFPEEERRREVLALPSGRLPIVLLSPIEKKAKVKAFMPDGVPINFSIQY